MLVIILLGSAFFFTLAYFFYGRFLDKRYDIDKNRATPSHTDYDGIDRVPANKAVLLGHHFSSIAGAGPVVGPIIAALLFGWLPVLVWIIIGAIFIGGVHDFSALIISVRHKARSIADIAKEYISPVSCKLFLIFIWLSLIYVLIVFTDLASKTFVEDGGVASSSLIFILLAVGFGLFVYRYKMSVLWASMIFVPLVFVAVWFGQQMPISADKLPCIVGNDPAKTWSIILLFYCLIASTTPVWILLQPRDYLSSYLLYASLIGGFIGILLGGFEVNYPMFTSWSDAKLGPLFPMLFVTVACGACSGFHSVVASGTSSKQLNNETDGRIIGYGAMLVEGIFAVIALVTVIVLKSNDPLLSKAPPVIYAQGMGMFLSTFGLSEKVGIYFGLLALSAFILTTLDTATRLGRYIFEELFGLKGTQWRYLSTITTLILPAIFVLITLRDAAGNPIPAWQVIWPVFGATNQLLAGLVLLVVALWLRKNGKKTFFVIMPMLFMNILSITALVILLKQYKFSAIGIIAAVLLILALVLIFEACRQLRYKTTSETR